ncbi:MAG TPA: sensor domain-containing diguanylate cyclase [Acidimicrobiales bacterium]|nr:sensor domain-containing diguanylate cyclase [Acidimicrobiales bacterium]
MVVRRRLTGRLLSVLLVVGTGVLGLMFTVRASDKTEGVIRHDRDTLQATLSGLGEQYLLFSMKEGIDYSSTGTWSLKPGSPADAARLQYFVQHAVFLNYGVALLNLSGALLNAYAAGPGLPPPTDPGYAPMRQSLLAGKPDVSSVMHVGNIPVVAMAVPVTVSGTTQALFVGYVRLDRSPLETYVEHLHYAKTGIEYVLDSTGTVVAATKPSLVGTHLRQPRALAALAKGASGDYQQDGLVVAYAPFGVSGWSGLVTQSTGEFFGPVRSGSLHVELALVGLLAVASVLIIILGHRGEAARRRLQEQLSHQAYHDGLTGLANRSLFHSRLQQAMARARRHGTGVGILYLDLDGFKPVNDREGHEAGDALLVEVARRLSAVVRTEDTVARMGGDEFAVLMEDLPHVDAACTTAERLVQEVRRPVVLDARQTVVEVSVSIGVAYSARGTDDIDALLRDADLAMYRAKDSRSGHALSEWNLGERTQVD